MPSPELEEPMPDSAVADPRMPVESVPVGSAVPRRNYGLLRPLARWILRCMDWRSEGEFPDQPKLVIAIAPHSSSWDFIIGAAFLYLLGLRVAFIAKHTLFFWPLGGFLRWLGGIPVNRAQPEDLTGVMAAAFGKHEQLWLAITPEGTRTEGARFKSGFYRIARAAGVPILPVYFNYRRRVTGFLPLIHPGDDITAGVEQVRLVLQQHGARRRSKADQ
jgi:1-acyl-sn-glycerol-3-phosphate acyltransferase